MENKPAIFQPGTKACAIFGASAGAVIALLILFLGFWRTLFVLAFIAVGFALGYIPNKADKLKKKINTLFPPKGE